MHLVVVLVICIQFVSLLHCCKGSKVIMLNQRYLLCKIMLPSPDRRRGAAHAVIDGNAGKNNIFCMQGCVYFGKRVTIGIIYYIVIFSCYKVRILVVNDSIRSPCVATHVRIRILGFFGIARKLYHFNGAGITIVTLRSSLYLKIITVHQIFQPRIVHIPSQYIITRESTR